MTAATTVKILAVDDVPENLVALRALIDRADVEVLAARSADEALELMLVAEVAVALIDVRMPGTDGFQLAELMRGADRTRHIPIIFLTAGPRDPTRTFRGYEAGAVDFLYKPLDPLVLRGKVDVFIELHRQRAELARQIDLLEQTIRLDEMFATVLGHDLRGPLTAVTAGTAVLLHNPESERVQRVATRINSSATRMARMIEQLLDFARLRHGGLALNPTPTQLDAVVKHVIAEHEAGGETRLTLETVGDTGGSWDADRLLQIVGNLVGNACTHGAAGGPIRVRVDGRGADGLVLEIANGGTIDPALIPRLFHPFLSARGAARGEQGRGPELQARKGGGLGLGLYIVKQIVEAHGGAVSVRSEPEDGTVFRVQLPRQPNVSPFQPHR